MTDTAADFDFSLEANERRAAALRAAIKKNGRLAVKNVEVVESLSEETLCFSATLYVDGKRTATVSNRGQGGPDEIHPVKFDAATKERVQEAHRIAEEIEPDFQSLEIVLSRLVQDYKQEQWLRGQLRTRTLFKQPSDKPGEYSYFKTPSTEKSRAMVLAKYPDATCITDISQL